MNTLDGRHGGASSSPLHLLTLSDLPRTSVSLSSSARHRISPQPSHYLPTHSYCMLYLDPPRRETEESSSLSGPPRPQNVTHQPRTSKLNLNLRYPAHETIWFILSITLHNALMSFICMPQNVDMQSCIPERYKNGKLGFYCANR